MERNDKGDCRSGVHGLKQVRFPPGPFDPGAPTLLYLPSIADDAPDAEKEGFYRSFNNHFNRMIIAHEIFPGHAMQFTLGLAHASQVRAARQAARAVHRIDLPPIWHGEELLPKGLKLMGQERSGPTRTPAERVGADR